MLDVLITIDTELQFRSGTERDLNVEANLHANIFGQSADGEHGLGFQLTTFRRHHLKAVFFVEALASHIVGLDPLQRTVERILDHEQEVQLHLHPEWLRRIDGGLFGEAPGMFMLDYSLEQQAELIAIGAQNLVRAGAPAPIAFRAGCFAANDDTLRAVQRNDLPFDSSFNAACRGRPCDISCDSPLPHPRPMEGIVEVPVTVFEDLPGHVRPMQITASSFSELTATLEHGYSRRWPLVVILLHSFELLTETRHHANRVAVRRFERLCAFLDEHRDRFRTVWFEDLDLDLDALARTPAEGEPARSNVLRTLGRVSEQALSRWDEWKRPPREPRR